MSLSGKEFYGPFTAVPQKFHSFLTEGPFDRCLTCNKYLLDEGVGYVIEKIYKGTEVIVEHAICIKCCLNMRQELSQESMERIDRYFEQRVDIEERRTAMRQSGSTDWECWLSTCLLTGRDISELEEYQIYALCDGSRLLLAGYPFMISGMAAGELQKLLSQKTRDRLDDFIDEHHGLPSEFKDIYDNSPLILI